MTLPRYLGKVLPCLYIRPLLPRLVQAQVHPPARAVRSRPFVSAGPFCRGSFALGTGRSPRRKPHVHCMWKRLAGTGDARLVHWQAQVHPPARAVRSRPFVSAGPFCRGSFPLGTGRSPRRKPHVHCMWKRLAAVRPRLKLHARRMGPSHPGGPGVRRE